MRISELIKALEAVRKEHGDLKVTGNILEEEVTKVTVLDEYGRSTCGHSVEAEEVFIE